MAFNRCGILCLFLLCKSLWSANCPLGGTTLVFGNGLNTNKTSATASMFGLEAALLNRLDQTGNSFPKSCLVSALAYDSEYVDSNNILISTDNLLAQLVDAAVQKGIDDLSSSEFWNWWDGLLTPPDWFLKIVSTSITAAAAIVRPDLDAHVSFYNAELSSGNKVIVAAHSQGNFYVNEAYTLLKPTSQFAVVAIATPAIAVAGSGPWFTLHNDIIKLVEPSLPENVINDPPSPCLDLNFLGCHDFDNSYMVGDKTRPAILDALIAAIPFAIPGTGTVAAQAMLDGALWSGPVAYNIVCPFRSIIGTAVPGATPGVSVGSCTITYNSGGPPRSVLIGTTPSATQTVTAGGTTTFTLNFKTSTPPSADFLLTESSVAPHGSNFTYAYTFILGASGTVNGCNCTQSAGTDSAIYFDFPGYVAGTALTDSKFPFVFSTSTKPAIVPVGHVSGVPVAEIYLVGNTPVKGPLTFHFSIDSIYGVTKQESFSSQDYNMNGQIVSSSGSVIAPNAPPPTLTDDFNAGTLDATRWSVEGPGGAGVVSQHLEISLGPGTSGGGIVSNCSLAGDFDVQADYILLNWPSHNPYGLRIGATDLTIGQFGEPGVYRNSGPTEFYTFVSAGGASQLPTSDTSGTLRLVRSGVSLQGLFLQGGTWIGVGGGQAGTGPTRINFDIGGITTPGGVKVAFDNVVMNSGNLVCQ